MEGPDGEQKCEGAVMGDKTSPKPDKIVRLSISQIQPVQTHKDEMQGDYRAILDFVRKLVFFLDSCG